MTSTYDVPARVRDGSPNLMPDMDAWRRAYARASADPDAFFLQVARERVVWRTPPTRGLDGSFHDIANGPVAWFSDGVLNVTESCVDRHAARDPDGVAILWEGDEPGDARRITWRELHERVCRMANALAALGLQKGERVVIYMGMVPEAAIAMLAAARLGAVHSVVFGGFSAEALRDRIVDSGAELLITQDEGKRGGRPVPLKATADAALAGLTHVRHVVTFAHTGAAVARVPGRDLDWHTLEAAASPEHVAVPCAAEDPLFILYTSGSTGRPKGLVHTCGGYLTWATFTHREVFDVRPGDVYGCVADVGWITGHSYIVYGPLSNGVTTLMFEGTPLYPGPDRYWELVARARITILYAAPTALRALAAHGDAPVRAHDLSSLRVLGTVGEPINPAAWTWYHDVVGQGRCAVVDTWWQTETGGVMMSPIAPATPTRPGSATFPLPGVHPVLVDAQGRRLRGPGEGHLCLEFPWPGIARTVWGDHDRYVATYFLHHPPMYFTGDGCRRDADGYHWITGRVDDVINVSGHRMGTAEFESALVATEEVAEAAVVGFPHALKGQGVYAFIVLQGPQPGADALERVLQGACRQAIGAHARVDRFQVVPGLPKTRSGKVMRRILRKIAEGDTTNLGDLSTLADPGVVDAIIAGAKA